MEATLGLPLTRRKVPCIAGAMSDEEIMSFILSRSI